MKIFIVILIICAISGAYLSGWNLGIASERKHERFNTLKFDGGCFVKVNEITTLRSLSSGRMITYAIIRGNLEDNGKGNSIEIRVNNQEEFSDMIKTYFGIEDSQVITRILPNTARWLVSDVQGRNRVIFSPENGVAFSEMKQTTSGSNKLSKRGTVTL